MALRAARGRAERLTTTASTGELEKAEASLAAAASSDIPEWQKSEAVNAQGRLKNWWTEKDQKHFAARGQCVVDQFEGYFIEPGIHHNGKLVLGESIGDLAGAKIAFLAYQKSREGKGPEPTIDGFTPEQQFFIAWGQWRGDEIRPETQRTMIQGDPHPVAKYRVNGPLSNLTQFAEAFECKAGDPMVRDGEKRCEVW